MEGDPQVVCKFHQYGHCKFGPHCRHFHTKDTCSTPACKNSSCTARHPKPCLYLSRNSYCKFGSSCSFLHQNPAPESCQLQNDVEKLKDDLQLVVTSLNIKEIELRKLEKKVTELEKKLSSQSLFKCDVCDFSSSSETILKRHKSTKHKKETLREENISETSLEVSPVKGERSHELNKSDSSISDVEEPGPSSPIKVSQIVDNKPNPLAAEDIKCDKCGYDFFSGLDALVFHKKWVHHEIKLIFKCNICKFTSTLVTDMKSHIVSIHKNSNPSAEHFSCSREPMCETCFATQTLNPAEYEWPSFSMPDKLKCLECIRGNLD